MKNLDRMLLIRECRVPVSPSNHDDIEARKGTLRQLSRANNAAEGEPQLANQCQAVLQQACVRHHTVTVV